MRVLFALAGLHRYNRGAEIAFLAVATELAKGGDEVTLIGSGTERDHTPYRFLAGRSIRRETFERFPTMPLLRHQYAYEELTFVPSLLQLYRPQDYDVTLTCSYPYTNWALRRPVLSGRRPPHVFVTQNGDWPAQATNSEYRFFGCEGLVCINPEYYNRNSSRWNCDLISNGVDVERFKPAAPSRQTFGLPENRPIALMVSALIPSKRVDLAIDAVSRLPDLHLAVAGDGPERSRLDEAASQKLPGRFTRLSVPPTQMPKLYQSANLFVHMSKDEPFGNVYLEAMACGLPIVAHDSLRTRWIVGENEFLADSDDADAVAVQIAQAVKSDDDARKLARGARAVDFSWPVVAAKYRSFLQRVAGAS